METQPNMEKALDAPGTTHLDGKYMTFTVAGETYGLPIQRVREIIGFMPITPMPCTEPSFRGIINLRGKVIPVVDIRITFGMSSCEPTDQTVIIVVHHQLKDRNTTVGILVDQVLEVLSIGAEKIEPSPDFDNRANPGFILGIGKTEHRVIFLLDISRALSPGMETTV